MVPSPRNHANNKLHIPCHQSRNQTRYSPCQPMSQFTTRPSHRQRDQHPSDSAIHPSQLHSHPQTLSLPHKSVTFTSTPPTTIPPLTDRQLRRRRQRVAKKSHTPSTTPKHSIGYRVRKRQPCHHNRNTTHAAQTARTDPMSTRSALCHIPKTSANIPATLSPTTQHHRPSRSKRSLPAAIPLKQLLTHRLEQLLRPDSNPSHWHTPQVCNAINIDTGREANYQEL